MNKDGKLTERAGCHLADLAAGLIEEVLGRAGGHVGAGPPQRRRVKLLAVALARERCTIVCRLPRLAYEQDSLSLSRSRSQVRCKCVGVRVTRSPQLVVDEAGVLRAAAAADAGRRLLVQPAARAVAHAALSRLAARQLAARVARAPRLHTRVRRVPALALLITQHLH